MYVTTYDVTPYYFKEYYTINFIADKRGIIPDNSTTAMRKRLKHHKKKEK